MLNKGIIDYIKSQGMDINQISKSLNNCECQTKIRNYQSYLPCQIKNCPICYPKSVNYKKGCAQESWVKFLLTGLLVIILIVWAILSILVNII